MRLGRWRRCIEEPPGDHDSSSPETRRSPLRRRLLQEGQARRDAILTSRNEDCEERHLCPQRDLYMGTAITFPMTATTVPTAPVPRPPGPPLTGSIRRS